MSRYSRCAFLLLLSLSLLGGARAQVVNIEGRRFMQDSVPWTGFVNVRFNVSESGQRSLNLGLNGAVQYLNGRDRYMFISDLAFSQVEANDFLNTGFQHLRYNYRKDSLWTGAVFAQAQYNKPLRLDLRLMLGAGPRLTAVDNTRMRVNIGTAVMVENEHVTNGPTTTIGRSSNYVSATLKFTDMASLTTVVYYQPKLFDASDHRIALEGGLLINVTKRMTVESRLNLLKDSAPPEEVNALSYSWSNLFGFRF
ncbi:MAG: DUF481 domain-containing protein [Flavobacteriales bacterium]|nr:DUF481 domain-containing protein [Flavobacteriales bacterium]